MNNSGQRVVIVTGLSGAGKATTLHVLEDIGYQAIDNPPLDLLEALVRRRHGRTAVGIDARSEGFDAQTVLSQLAALRADPFLRLDLIFCTAEDQVLMRRYTETRRRHPLAPDGRVIDGITREREITSPLRAASDLVIDTSDLPPASLRRMVEDRFGAEDGGQATQSGLSLSLISFAYPAGLPREADLVFDARFLRNPHYDPLLRPHTGLEADVAAYIESDPDCAPFFRRLTDLLELVLPRFVQEGKKYATIGIGCTGGRHRSVYLIEKLASHLAGHGWRVSVTHRELGIARGAPRNSDVPAKFQAQEA